MTQLIPNSFSTYDLSEDELLQASILTPLQKQGIHNQLAIFAEERLALEFDPSEPSLRYTQKESHLKGQIQALQYLLTSSAFAEASIHQLPDTNPL